MKSIIVFLEEPANVPLYPLSFCDNSLHRPGSTSVAAITISGPARKEFDGRSVPKRDNTGSPLRETELGRFKTRQTAKHVGSRMFS
ncbi:MAG: hypothetical protein BJ554DRAFT_2723 [Olpidium bornovanus]|uniref:Uncharacterized protein n=1 Tax=Olpidium bornovanus TaxID=278681 RepID=A0A8H7ZQJ3_9FUNG|nr:MAG: hypothetical protein BJ554DRAFT_2723 [Olpidium bornovanus]